MQQMVNSANTQNLNHAPDDQLIATISTLWQKNRLGHFYMVRFPCHAHQLRPLSWQWCQDLIQELRALHPQEKWQMPQADLKELNLWSPHPDCLMLFPSSESQYVKEDLEEFFTFVQLRPGKLHKRLLFLFDAHKLGLHNLPQRLLKTLEDPGENHCIFFLTTRDGQFLSTIESRALTMRPQYPHLQKHIASEQQGEIHLQQAFEEFNTVCAHAHVALSYLKGASQLHQVLEEDWSTQDLLRLQSILSQWVLVCRPLNGDQLSIVAQLHKNLQEWRTYHHPIYGQVALLLNTFRQLYAEQNAANVEQKT